MDHTAQCCTCHKEYIPVLQPNCSIDLPWAVLAARGETSILRAYTQLAPVFACGQQMPRLSFCRWAFFDATSHEFQTLLKSDSTADSLVTHGEV